jgi:uncharacterized secreted repeat protein (TIGR03808 family)
MDIDRRALLVAAAVPGAVLLAGSAKATLLSTYGADATQFDVHAGASGDQSRALQQAIDLTASTRTPLLLDPGIYRAGNLKLPAGAQLLGARGATRFVFTQNDVPRGTMDEVSSFGRWTCRHSVGKAAT